MKDESKWYCSTINKTIVSYSINGPEKLYVEQASQSKVFPYKTKSINILTLFISCWENYFSLNYLFVC